MKYIFLFLISVILILYIIGLSNSDNYLNYYNINDLNQIMNRGLHINYINLDSRFDRKKMIEKEFFNLPNIHLRRFSAIKTPDKGGIGCCLSHISVLRYALKKKLPYICIVEDDFKFNIPRDKAMYNIFCSLAYLKDDWDILMLSASKYNLQKTKFTPFLSKVIEAQAANGYIVNSRYYQKLLDNFIEGVIKLEKDYSQWNKFAIDQYWKKLQPNDKWFILEPLVAIQRESFSDIENKIVKYAF